MELSITMKDRKDFGDSLVDFDYDVWKKFDLKLYWTPVIEEPNYVWPLRILTVRVHPEFQVVGLVDDGSWEELVAFNIETGRDYKGRRTLMDLDSLSTKPTKGPTRKTVLAFIMMWWKRLKKKYGNQGKRFIT